MRKAIVIAAAVATLSGCAAMEQQARMESINAARAEVQAFCDAALRDPSFAILEARTPVAQPIQAMSMDMRLQADHPTPTERDAISAWAANARACANRNAEAMARFDAPRHVDNYRSTIVANDRARFDLYAGKLTWGQYNERRLAIFEEYQAARARISAAYEDAARQDANVRSQAAAAILMSRPPMPAPAPVTFAPMPVPQTINCTTMPMGAGWSNTSCR